jgi:hypothetical protein
MTVEDAKKWEAIAKLYEQLFGIYVSFHRKIQETEYNVITKATNEALSSTDLPEYFSTDTKNKNNLPNMEVMSDNIPEHVYQIKEKISDVWEDVYKTADIYGEMKMNAYKTAGELYEELGDLENAAEMYHYSDDSGVDKSMELWDKIAEKNRNDQKN